MTSTSRARRVLPGIARATLATAAAAGLVVGATAVGGTVQLAAPHERAGLPASSDVLVQGATLVCPGQQRVGAAGLRTVEGTVRAAVASAPLGALPRAVPATGGSVALEPAGGGKAIASADTRGTAVPADVKGSAAVTAEASGALAPGLVATQSWLHLGDDDRGLAVTPCAQPAADLWLVAGGAGASRTERLVLTNPGANAITVSFEVLGAKGPVQGLEGHAVSIPPGSRTVVSVDALAPDEPGPVVHVIATGGVVAGVLNDAWIEGATGRGIDDATPSAAPATDLVLPGLQVDKGATLRLGNPGGQEALAQVRILSAEHVDQPAQLRAVRVPAGGSVDVPVTMAAPGAYGLHVVADHPLVAGAMIDRVATTGNDRMGDFGWAPATVSLVGTGGVVLPSLGQHSLTGALLIASATGGSATVTLAAGATTSSTTVTLSPDRATAVPLGAADRVWVTPTSGDVRAAVSVTGADKDGPLLSVAALTSAPFTAQSVPVRRVQN